MATWQHPATVFDLSPIFFTIVTRVAVLSWFLLIFYGKADVDEVANKEGKVDPEYGAPTNLIYNKIPSDTEVTPCPSRHLKDT